MKYRIALYIVILFFFYTPISFAQSDQKREIKIFDTGFNPANLVVPVGSTVVFQNEGEMDHWPASNIHPTHDIYPEFDPKKGILANQSWEFTFTQPGEWRFHDHLNPTLIGSIIVVGDLESGDPKIQSKPESSLLTKLKYQLLDIYFSVFPQDKTLWASRQSVAYITDKKDDTKLAYLINLVGPETVVQNLFEQSGRGDRFNCHISAHSVGRITYQELGEGALDKNITLCHSGYQHGIMAAFINATGTRSLIERLDKICENRSSEFARLTCYHGVGHGLMAYYDNDLPTAINRCLNLSDRFRQNNCMVGAFMENIGSRTRDSLNSHPTKWLNEADMHFPCNALNQSFQVQSMCYSIQVDWMDRFYKNDVTALSAECLKAPEQVQSSCFFGIGQEVALFTGRDPSKIIIECNKVPESANYRERCFIGAETIIIDYWGPNISDQGNKYCEVVPNAYQHSCWSTLENRLKDLNK